MEYTSIEQSKKLIELGLNIETADMVYASYNDVMTGERKYRKWAMELTPMMKIETERELPCWSLSALLELMPKIKFFKDESAYYPLLQKYYAKDSWICKYENSGADEHWYIEKTPIDACCDMICWLLENDYIKKGG